MTFDEAFRVVVYCEEIDDDPEDQDQNSKYGISKKDYPGEDISGLTLTRAKEIYRRDYWGPAGCDVVPDILRITLFNTAISVGVEAAIKALQYAVNEPEDGVLSARTLMSIQYADPSRLLFRFCAARLVVSRFQGIHVSARGRPLDASFYTPPKGTSSNS